MLIDIVTLRSQLKDLIERVRRVQNLVDATIMEGELDPREFITLTNMYNALVQSQELLNDSTLQGNDREQKDPNNSNV